MQSKYTAKDIARFWGKVDKTSSPTFYNGTRCWIWTAGCFLSGYGQISVGGKFGKSLLTHRLSYELAFGEIPNKLLVLHHCDNRPCCNPDHLFLGTSQDNSDDMKMKNRQALGEKNGRKKLSYLKVLEIRKRYSKKESLRKLAKEFGVSHVQISNIVNRKLWK